MKLKLLKIIEHIENNTNCDECACDCSMCEKQENGTFLDGLIMALNLIQK